MKITKIQLYILFGFSILLTLLQINSFFNMLGLFITCFIISYNCFKDINKSVKYGFFLLVVLSLVGILLKVNRYTFNNVKENLEVKNFEQEKNKMNTKTNNVNNVGKGDPSDNNNKEEIGDSNETNETDTNETETNETKDNFTNKESDVLNKYLNNIDINDDDEKYPDPSIIKNMSPAQAQRELYKLIDTTNLLKETMTEMTPIINEGKKIMKSIDSLNLLG
jgi:hypothetical protein